MTIHLKVTNAITLLTIVINDLKMVTKIGYDIQKECKKTERKIKDITDVTLFKYFK